jgi:hypothetical protein
VGGPAEVDCVAADQDQVGLGCHEVVLWGCFVILERGERFLVDG